MPARVALVMAQTAGGIGRHVSSLVPELISRGAEVSVIAPHSARRFANEDSGAAFTGVEIPRGMSPGQNVSAFRKLKLALKDHDLVHAHGIRAGLLSSAASKRAGVPHFVVTMHGEVLERSSGSTFVARVFEWATVGFAERSIYVSKTLAATASRRRRKSGGIVVIPAGANLDLPGEDEVERARESLQLAEGVKAIVAVGRLHPLKGFDVLLDAVHRMRADGFKVSIAGEGPERRHLEDLISSLGLSDRVALLGEREDARALIAAADVFCLPSLSEGTPLVIQEALAFGTPIVTTSVAGILETLGGGDAALIAKAGDPITLADALDLMISDADLRKTMADKARAASKRLIDSGQVAGRIGQLYEELLGRSLSAVSRARL